MDKIHLVALMKSGELNYSIYENGSWSNAIIAKFDLHSNLYGQLNVFVEDNNINIIYGYANLINSKLWTIQHVIGQDNNWNQHSIIKFASEKNDAYYIVDRDTQGNIQLVYSSTEGFISQIYHTFYNSYAKKWNPTPQKLISSAANKMFPYVFVDIKGNIHSLWLEDIDKNKILKYSRFTATGDRKYIWNQIKIPYISNCSNLPIMFEDKGILKVVYSKYDCIGYIYSPDYGTTWYKGDVIKANFVNIYLIKISANILGQNNIKINDIYGSIDKQLYLAFLDCFNSSETDFLDSKVSLEKSTLEKSELEEIHSIMNQILKSQEEINLILSNNIDSQNRIEENIKGLFDMLKNRKDSFFDKLFK